jgi:2-polyprenyl-6-hydroxyphenyl methylase/3-demethylubiquinone-9 3-methyltransferase
MTVSPYLEKLSAEKLKRCYEIAPPRVQQYLRAETEFVLKNIRPGDVVLDLGCGYGRTMRTFAHKAGFVVGIDISCSSLLLGQSYLRLTRNRLLLEMDAAKLAFFEGTFDAVVCIQNGISAFHRDPCRLFQESVRVAKPSGVVLFSTYSEKFWDHRLEWFRKQAEEGLLGEIVEERTGNGVIVCRDGFQASTCTGKQFRDWAAQLPVSFEIIEVDQSSLFCVIGKRRNGLSGNGQIRASR